MKNNYIEILKEIRTYLRLHNRVLFDKLDTMLQEIELAKTKRNKRVLEQITEKRKLDPNYGREKKRREKKNGIKEL